MRFTSLIPQVVVCAMSMQVANAQQAPKLPKDTTLLQAPFESFKTDLPLPLIKPHIDQQVPLGVPTQQGSTQEFMRAEVKLMTVQTDTIKALSKRIDELEARVQQLEAAKKFGSQK